MSAVSYYDLSYYYFYDNKRITGNFRFIFSIFGLIITTYKFVLSLRYSPSRGVSLINMHRFCAHTVNTLANHSPNLFKQTASRHTDFAKHKRQSNSCEFCTMLCVKAKCSATHIWKLLVSLVLSICTYRYCVLVSASSNSVYWIFCRVMFATCFLSVYT